MSKKILWLVVSGLIALSLVMAACGPAAVEEKKAPVVEEKKPAPVVEEKKQETPVVKEVVKPVPEAPKYGGTLVLPLTSDIRSFDPHDLVQEGLVTGDWAKGPAGGYGTGETDWANYYDIFDHKKGALAESWKWIIDEAKNQGTIVYQIRQGVRWALNPASEASRLVGGRALTTDDVMAYFNRVRTDPLVYMYGVSPEIRTAEVIKTGSSEITVKVPLNVLISTASRFSNGFSTRGKVAPPEVLAKYGNMDYWRNSVGTGPFIINDYIPGSTLILVKNPNYWQRDQIGPGKGNQLPYLDRVQYVILPDASTRQAAMRTGKIDWLDGLRVEDAVQLKRAGSPLMELQLDGGAGQSPITMRTDKAPFSDIRVRRAMMMAIDFEAINQSLFGGRGKIISYPFTYSKVYSALYLGLDDPEFPESARELYSYHPEKAKQLLKEAGYPGGFKTSLILTSSEVDYYSIIKDYFAKVGIDMRLDVRESGVHSTIRASRTHPEMITSGSGPPSGFLLFWHLTGEGGPNTSMINDTYVNETAAKIRRIALNDMQQAMRMTKEMSKYVVDQAWAIQAPSSVSYRFWWPWIKGYSGEVNIGFVSGNWPTWVWLDEELKKSMGY